MSQTSPRTFHLMRVYQPSFFDVKAWCLCEGNCGFYKAFWQIYGHVCENVVSESESNIIAVIRALRAKL